MARYDYRCPSCGTTFEVEHPMSERPSILCPTCGQPAERVFDPSGILLKGSGFYNTDQREAPKAASDTAEAIATSTSDTTPTPSPCEGCSNKAGD